MVGTSGPSRDSDRFRRRLDAPGGVRRISRCPTSTASGGLASHAQPLAGSRPDSRSGPLVRSAFFVALLALGLALRALGGGLGLVAGIGVAFLGVVPAAARVRALVRVPDLGVGRAGLGQLVRDVAGVALLLAAVRLGRALVDRVPTLDLVAVD